MIQQTKEEQESIEEKLDKIHLDLQNIPEIFQTPNIIKYRPQKGYYNSNYNIYRYVNIKDIEIYLTPTTRLEEVNRKYKLAKPLICYLDPNNEENLETYLEFLNMLKQLDVNKLGQIEEEQKRFYTQIPYEVKYKDNFMWDIYYSEIEDKYFMLFPTKETRVETLFYIIKEKIKSQKDKKIYVPINQEEYSYNILKKSEIADLENYLWLFTKSWPTTYEVQDKNRNKTIQVIGKTPVYEKIKSKYKFTFTSKKEAQEQFKLIKALFILQSHLEQNYTFTTLVNENGSLDFCFNRNRITYHSLPQFINTEIEKNTEKIKQIQKKNLLITERLLLLEESTQKQKEEYIKKEKQIVTFLECKKSFFGKVSYYFKSKKVKKEEVIEEKQNKEKDKMEIKDIEIEKKDFYTIEDLLKVCNMLDEKEKEYKNKEMDIHALENKKENLEKKIKNATLYINEIEKHKKSIFEFWKFTSKDEVSLLQEGEEKQQKEKKGKIKKVFSYEDDIEEFGQKMDENQKQKLLPKEMDSIFAIRQDIESFNIVRKEKIQKKEESKVEKSLKQMKEKYERDFEKIKEKDFDIFGSVVEDKTKIKLLNNKKHREIEKDTYKVLNIHPNTTLEEYKDILKHYLLLLEEAYPKIVTPYDIAIYQTSYKEPLEEKEYQIFHLNPKSALQNINLEEDTIILNRINVKENMPLIFYTNSMYYDNINKTLPAGMDIGTEVLIDLKQYEMKLISRKDFNMNFIESEFESKVKTIQVYEYDIEKVGKE